MLSPQERIAVESAARDTIRDLYWVGGDAVREFEEQFADFVGAHEAVGVGNGTDALVIAMKSLQLPVGSQVLVCATDGGYSAIAARQAGLTPVVIDIDHETWMPTRETAQSALTGLTSAIVITHLHGNLIMLSDIDYWRKEHGLAMIEDCAQAHGLRNTEGEHVGMLGDASTFSFYPTKNLGAVGDGGAITFSAHAAQSGAPVRARQLREYGWGERYRIELSGGMNSRLDSLQARILSARLPFLEQRNDRRNVIRSIYAEALGLHSNAPARASLLGIGLPSVVHHAVVRTRSPRDREDLRDYLQQCGIQTGVHYPWLVNEMTGLELENPEPTPVADARRNRILSIPCSPELSDEQTNRVAQALNHWSHN